MSNKFLTFLKKHKVLKGEDITHTSLGNPTGSYYIPHEHSNTFIELYHTEYKKNTKLYLTEKHRSTSPIVIDLDFRYDKDSIKVIRKYSQEHIKSFLKVYMKYLLQYVVTFEKPQIFLLEKPTPRYDVNKGICKDGVHIVIPNIVTIPSTQYKIREIVVEHMQNESNIFEDCEFLNDTSDIFDKAVIEKNNWLMYGSAKPDTIPYQVTHIYDYIDGEFVEYDETNFPNDLDIIKMLSIRNKLEVNEIQPDKISEIHTDELIAIEEERKRVAVSITTQRVTNVSVNTIDNIEVVQELIRILSKSRADAYDDWIRVGWCLRNIDNNLLDDWIEFSKQSDKYIEGDCEKFWNQMREGGLGIKTLHMWAKKDNYEMYDDILKRSGGALLVKAIQSMDNWDIAQVIHHFYQHLFRCVSIKQETWYYFTDHKWNKCESAYVLRNHMSTTIHDLFDKKCNEIIEKARAISMEAMQAEIKSKRPIVKNFKNTNFKSRLTKECADIFNDSPGTEKFHEQLDTAPHLLCFKNGVYDLDNSEFREGRPEDNISLSTNINYVEYDESDPVYEEINHFLETVQPNKDKREYILRTLANSLHGSNREEKVYFWTGEGGNGKSKLYSLLESCMGDYSCNISVSYLTQKRASSNSASPEMVKAIGRRFVVFQEPEEHEKVNAGLLKEISGKDKIAVRGLYKDADQFTPQFQVILICNQLPSLPATDGGVWRRVRKITFDSSFVEDPNPANPNEFKIDQDLDKKWPDWKIPFLSMLIHYYNKYKNLPSYEPPEVTDATKEYQQVNDKYLDFIETHLQRQSDLDENSTLSLADTFEEFKEYCRIWNKNKEMVNSEALKASIVRRFGKSKLYNNRCYWKGIKLLTVSSDKNKAKFEMQE